MLDCDRNGKVNWRDDVVFNEIISRKSGSSNNSRPVVPSGRLPWWFWALLAVVALVCGVSRTTVYKYINIYEK